MNSPTLKAMGANREGDFSRWYSKTIGHGGTDRPFGQSNATRSGLHLAPSRLPNSMARQSQQGQALRVLASSQPCSLSLSMLHLQVAKAKRRLPPAGLRGEGFSSRTKYILGDPPQLAVKGVGIAEQVAALVRDRGPGTGPDW